MGERRKTSSAIYKNILPPVKEHLDEGRRSSRGAARFGFRKAVSVTLVFLVVTQFNVRGREVEGRGDALPAWLKTKKSERGGEREIIQKPQLHHGAYLPCQEFALQLREDECSTSHAAQLTPFNTTSRVYTTRPLFLVRTQNLGFSHFFFTLRFNNLPCDATGKAPRVPLGRSRRSVIGSHLVFLSHAVNELHHFNEVLAAEGVVDGVGGEGPVLPVPPLGQGQLSGKWRRVSGTALRLGTT